MDLLQSYGFVGLHGRSRFLVTHAQYEVKSVAPRNLPPVLPTVNHSEYNIIERAFVDIIAFVVVRVYHADTLFRLIKAL